MTPAQRRQKSYRLRVAAATSHKSTPAPTHPSNGDEAKYASRIGNYSKGLPHNGLGEVLPGAYLKFLKAVSTGKPADFEAIPLAAGPKRRKLVNPQAGLAFDLEGLDSHQFGIIAPPAFDSREQAAEIVENYWMALLRDVNFNDYGSSPLAGAAATELSGLPGYKGPRSGGTVTPDVLFRGVYPGDKVGPYLSQFLLLPANFGSQIVDMRQTTYLHNTDYMTAFPDWLGVQNGEMRGLNDFDTKHRYIRNGRDISAFVHIDVLYQSYFNACLTLLHLNAPLNDGNPYMKSKNQEGFGTFGGPHLKTIVAEVSTRALKTVWYQKWFVHRRLRPEAFGGAIHNVNSGAAAYPVHSDALTSMAVSKAHTAHGTWLLPMAFPEGSPLHPSYGQGHGTVAGACVTILKAFFNGKTKIAHLLKNSPPTFPVKKPVICNFTGLALIDYPGPDAAKMTVEGELNKLAANIAIGRNHAGVHWRSDYTESLKLGEKVAIDILRDQKSGYNETFGGLKFTRFDGTTVVV